MKVAIAQCPMLTDVEVQPQPRVRAQRHQESTAETRQHDRQMVVAYVCKSAVVLSGAAMIYCMVSFGRIFENYLQW